jgi:cytochrome c oxidase cbb3-type subunit 3
LRRQALILCALLLLGLGIALAVRVTAQRRADTLLRADPARAISDQTMRSYAIQVARPVYTEHCASCHGATLAGDRMRGTPDLGAGEWVYGREPIEVERTILYGIRSGHPKARNLTDMPGLVASGQITESNARDVVQYLQSLAHRPYDSAAAERGRTVFDGDGNCYDCHGGDARGIAEIGAPALTGPGFLYGGDGRTEFLSVCLGRHGQCPAWIHRLTPLQVRALAIYLVSSAGATTSGGT